MIIRIHSLTGPTIFYARLEIHIRTSVTSAPDIIHALAKRLKD